MSKGVERLLRLSIAPVGAIKSRSSRAQSFLERQLGVKDDWATALDIPIIKVTLHALGTTIEESAFPYNAAVTSTREI
jgi:hypothetical protein